MQVNPFSQPSELPDFDEELPEQLGGTPAWEAPQVEQGFCLGGDVPWMVACRPAHLGRKQGFGPGLLRA